MAVPRGIRVIDGRLPRRIQHANGPATLIPGGARGLLRVIWLLAAVVLFGSWSPRFALGGEPREEAVPAFEYIPGRGLEIGKTGLNLGGYAKAEVEKPEADRARFALEYGSP